MYHLVLTYYRPPGPKPQCISQAHCSSKRWSTWWRCWFGADRASQSEKVGNALLFTCKKMIIWQDVIITWETPSLKAVSIFLCMSHTPDSLDSLFVWIHQKCYVSLFLMAVFFLRIHIFNACEPLNTDDSERSGVIVKSLQIISGSRRVPWFKFTERTNWGTWSSKLNYTSFSPPVDNSAKWKMWWRIWSSMWTYSSNAMLFYTV